MSEAKQKPVKQFRAGALGVSLWKREHNGESFYNATPSRCYKDEKRAEGEQWVYTDSFGRDDLPIISALMSEAFAWIVATEAEAKKS
jgi:hypothetical protein